MKTIFLGLGSNLGNREKNIACAIKHLQNAGVEVEKRSSIMETDPVGGPPQGKYLNAVIKGSTALTPHQLLHVVQSIEKDLGRVKTVPNGPRTIDIDILLYSDLQLNTPELVIPHPRMRRRPFVLQPLKEIAPELTIDEEQ